MPAGYYGEISAIAPMIRDTGNFAITMGDTSWNLTGVHFDTPNPTAPSTSATTSTAAHATSSDDAGNRFRSIDEPTPVR